MNKVGMLSPVEGGKMGTSKEEEGKVCRALQEFYNDGIAEGKKTGISVFVQDYLEDGKEPEIIINKLIYRFELSEQEAQKYLQEAMQKGRTMS